MVLWELMGFAHLLLLSKHISNITPLRHNQIWAVILNSLSFSSYYLAHHPPALNLKRISFFSAFAGRLMRTWTWPVPNVIMKTEQSHKTSSAASPRLAHVVVMDGTAFQMVFADNMAGLLSHKGPAPTVHSIPRTACHSAIKVSAVVF